MTVLQQYGTSDTSTEAEKIKQYIASMPLLDIGIIRKIDGNIADVQLCSNASIYPLELIDCGSGDATLLPAFAGQYCLVLNVTTPLNITDGTTDLGGGLNSIAKAKALPIGAARAADVNMTVRKDGVILGSTEYSLSFLKEKLQFLYGMCEVSFDGDGVRIGNQHFGLSLLNEQFRYVSNAEYDEKTGDLKTAGSIVTVDNATGDIQIQTGVDVENDKVQVSINIAADGTMSIEADSVTLKAASGLTFDGDVEITGSLNVADGNFTVDK